MERAGSAPLEEHGEPDDERERERRRPVEGRPDEMGEREHEPEEHREPPPAEVVAHDDADRV